MKVVPFFRRSLASNPVGMGLWPMREMRNHHFDLIYLVATAEGQVTLTKSNFVKKGTLGLVSSAK